MTAAGDLRRRRVRNQALGAAALALTAGGIVVAALQPPGPTGPLHDLVRGSGAAAPVLFIALCVVASPVHLTGLVVALSALVWPLPVAAALSFTGCVLGCLTTAGALMLMGAGPVRGREGWPAWMERLSARVARRPLLVGLALRIVGQSGLAVEGFFLLTGYTRRRYLVVTVVGVAVVVAQNLVGVTVLAALVRIAPSLAILVAVVPVLVLAAVVLVVRRRSAAPHDGGSGRIRR